MEMFPEQPKFTLGTGSVTGPLRYAVDEDKDSGIDSVPSPFLPPPYSLPFPLGGEK